MDNEKERTKRMSESQHLRAKCIIQLQEDSSQGTQPSVTFLSITSTSLHQDFPLLSLHTVPCINVGNNIIFKNKNKLK